MGVTVNLRGRCGNQMFQIAACIGHAIKYETYYSIPKETLNPKEWPAYFADKFKDAPGSIMHYLYKEPSHAYTPIPPCLHIKLDGYFQSEKYFSHCRNQVLKAFGFYGRNFEKNVCSVHIRRGDYLLYPSKHPVVTIEYLTQAINYISKMGIDNFLIFSDEIPYCKSIEHLLPQNVTYLYSEGNTELEDLDKMVWCGSHIISNSTFSWWGAWMCSNPDKIVVSPSKENWFGPGNSMLSTEDLIPDSWHQIKY